MSFTKSSDQETDMSHIQLDFIKNMFVKLICKDIDLVRSIENRGNFFVHMKNYI